ncbi:MAG: hypothetical protein AAF411_19480, partial [Myxococcota bacterium]
APERTAGPTQAGPTQAGPTRAEPEAPPTPSEPAQRFAANSGHPIEPAIGQWVRYGIRWRNGGRSTVRYALVDREAGGFWVEVEDRRRTGARLIRMHVRPRSGQEPELLALSFKQDGQVQEIPPRILPSMAPAMAQWLGLLFPEELAGVPNDIEVTAGVFPESVESEADLSLGPQAVSVVVARHSAVPLTGIVRLEDRAGEHRMELLGFGLEGARSTF